MSQETKPGKERDGREDGDPGERGKKRDRGDSSSPGEKATPAPFEDAAPAASPEAPPEDGTGPACEAVDLSSLTEEGLRALLRKAKEREEFLDRLRCLQAENENYRKRMARESTRHRLWGMRDFAQAVLPVIDNLERALCGPSEAAGSAEALREGVRRVLAQALESLARLQFRPIEAVGKSFDPAIHEALAEVPSAGARPGTVLEEVQRGWVLEDLLVRPARVVVAKAAPPPAADGEQGGRAGAQ
jgi:molecular chaperone GrpE